MTHDEANYILRDPRRARSIHEWQAAIGYIRSYHEQEGRHLTRRVTFTADQMVHGESMPLPSGIHPLPPPIQRETGIPLTALRVMGGDQTLMQPDPALNTGTSGPAAPRQTITQNAGGMMGTTPYPQTMLAMTEPDEARTRQIVQADAARSRRALQAINAANRKAWAHA
jgi:hypothetical protein